MGTPCSQVIFFNLIYISKDATIFVTPHLDESSLSLCSFIITMQRSSQLFLQHHCGQPGKQNHRNIEMHERWNDCVFNMVVLSINTQSSSGPNG